jgi:hypothetical protein
MNEIFDLRIRGYAQPARRGQMGRAQASASALNAPSPDTGEVRHTALPDTFDGIRFEIGRMIRYVQDASNDPVVRRHTSEVCAQYRAMVSSMNGPAPNTEPALCAEAIDAWCRDHFVYVNDPPNVEVIQTPRRMIKQTKIPKDVIMFFCEPFLEAFEQTGISFSRNEYIPPDVYIGDCDEAACAMLGMCACVGSQGKDSRVGSASAAKLGPLQYRFGGNDGTLHHVWSYVGVNGSFVDADHTEPDFKLGDHSSFEAFEAVEIPL